MRTGSDPRQTHVAIKISGHEGCAREDHSACDFDAFRRRLRRENTGMDVSRIVVKNGDTLDFYVALKRNEGGSEGSWSRINRSIGQNPGLAIDSVSLIRGAD